MQRLLLEPQPHPLFDVSEADPVAVKETGKISMKGFPRTEKIKEEQKGISKRKNTINGKLIFNKSNDIINNNIFDSISLVDRIDVMVFKRLKRNLRTQKFEYFKNKNKKKQKMITLRKEKNR